MNAATSVFSHIDYLVAVALFLSGAWILLTSNNLVKKIIGLNVMETSVFAFIVTTGMIDDGAPPLLAAGVEGPFASPLPHALVLTGIVVAVSVTSLALVLVLRIKAELGSVELDELESVGEHDDSAGPGGGSG